MALFGVPRLPPLLVPRKRLTDLLDSAVAFAVVRGPAGSGKSVLLTEWAARRADELRGIWVSVDESTATRVGFWRAVCDGLRDAGLLDASTWSDVTDRLGDLDSVRPVLLRMLSSLGEITVVIDSFESVDDPAIADDLVWLLRHCSTARAVVATRTMSELEAPATRVSLDPVVVLAEDLALTAEETERLLVDAGAEVARADELHEATGGLPLGVRIALLAVQSDPERFASVRGEDFAMRLGERVRELVGADPRQPRLLAFAARTAVAPFLTIELAEELSGCADAGELLEVAEREGLGMWSTSRHGRVFSYTPLVQAAFLAEAAASFPDERERLGRVAAAWCAEHGDGYTAVRLALDIEDFDLASTFLREVWPTDAAPTSAYMRRLTAIPRHRLRKHPLLLMVLALSYNASPSHRLRALETFGLAALAMRTGGQSVPFGERALLLAGETAAHRVSGRVQRALASAEKLTELLDGAGPDDADELGDGYVLARVHAGITLLHEGRTDGALRSFEQAYAQAAGRSSRTALHAAALVAGTHALLGNMRRAAEAVAAIEAGDWPQTLLTSYVGSFYHLAKAHLAIEAQDYAAAQDALDVVAPHVPTIEHWPLFTYLQSTVDLARGAAASRLVVLETELAGSSRPAVGSYLQRWLDAARAQLMLATGRVGELHQLMRKRGAQGAVLAAHRALGDLLQGDAQAAALLSGRVLSDDSLPPRLRVQLLCIAAVAALRLERPESASPLLSAAAALMREHGLRSALLLLPRTDTEKLLALERAQQVPEGQRLPVVDGALPDLMPREAPPAVELSARERIVLQKLVHTESATQIAAELYVSPNTVKSQLRTAYKKLGVNSREAALLAAAERGLLSE